MPVLFYNRSAYCILDKGSQTAHVACVDGVDSVGKKYDCNFCYRVDEDRGSCVASVGKGEGGVELFVLLNESIYHEKWQPFY